MMGAIKKELLSAGVYVFVIAAFSLGWFHTVSAGVPEELKQQIEEKNKSLEEVNQKLLQAQKSLGETTAKSKSLQQEVKRIDGNINQLSLTIRSSEINISKIKLEIDAIQYDIDDTEKQIDIKKGGVAQLLRELQKKDDESSLVILLKNKSISESIDEANAIVDINSSLSSEVNNLQVLSKALLDNLQNVANKKHSLEFENQNLKNRKAITESQKQNRQQLLVQTKNQEKSYQQQIAELENEQEDISAQIGEIEDQLRASFDPSLLPSKRPGVFAWPVKLAKDGGTAIVSQSYGNKSKLYKTGIHNGTDFGHLAVGSPVFAAEDGKIVAVDNNDKSSWYKYQYGLHILVEHSNNLTTLYAHLSAAVAHKGDEVKRGDLIGYSGNSGFSTGPHLHFGVYWTPSLMMKSIPPAKGFVPIGVTVDPEDYL